jgi:phosphatidylglycerophosphate synthase
MQQRNRRQLATRARAWPSALARALARSGVTPNMVSVASVVFAALAAVAYWLAAARSGGTGPIVWLVAAAAGIQLRLLCNLLDGLLAIEGGLKSATGELYNEIPDRFGDILILLGAGVAVRDYPYGMEFAVAATILAILTAYVRLLGGSLGFAQDFSGPMAKQHRMFTLTVGTLAAAAEVVVRGSSWSIIVALALIALGSLLTFARRAVRIAAQLRAR